VTDALSAPVRRLFDALTAVADAYAQLSPGARAVVDERAKRYRAALADAWDEGVEAQAGVYSIEGIAPNPYRETSADGWQFYCRICGATDTSASEQDRDMAALTHVDTQCKCAGRPNLGWTSHGHLAHVWRY
jgi:hypothetical protein